MKHRAKVHIKRYGYPYWTRLKNVRVYLKLFTKFVVNIDMIDR